MVKGNKFRLGSLYIGDSMNMFFVGLSVYSSPPTQRQGYKDMPSKEYQHAESQQHHAAG